MRRLTKLFAIIIFTLLLIPISSLLLIKFYPHSLIKFSQRFHSYDIATDKIDVSLLEPALHIHGLSVRDQQGTTLLSTDKLLLNSQWDDLILGNNNIGVASIKDSIVNIEALIQSLPSADTKAKPQAEADTIKTVDIHQLLQIADVSLHNIKLNAPNDVQINILKLESFNSAPNAQAGIDFDLHFQKSDVGIPIKGQFSSTAINNAEPQLRLHLPELDIRTLTAITDENNNSNESNEGNTATTIEAVNTLEQVIDWSPLEQFAPLAFNLAVDKIILSQGEISALLIDIAVKNLPDSSEKFAISYEQTGQLTIDLNDDFHYAGPLAIVAQWQTLDRVTKGADIQGQTKVILADNTVTIDGLINLNGVDAQSISLDVAVGEFPFTAKSPSGKSIAQQSTEFLPLTTKSKIEMANKALSLKDLSLNAGRSDLAGYLTIGLNQTLTALETIDFDFKSTQIAIPQQTTDNSDKKSDDVKVASTEENTDETVKADKLFNNEPIDSSLLDTINTKGQLNIEKIYYGKRILLEGLNSTLSLKEKTLSLNSQISQLAEGKVDTNISIKNNDGQLQLTTKGSVNNLLLESLALLPEGEFTGGKTDVSFALNSKGNSTQALASGLQGDFLLFSREGTIANNSFELVGSDLLLNLINTINPFYKKAKNTQLECAVVKSSIEDGKMKFDNSIAIKTSKMTVVADGNINLAKERINLGINPKARAGVGVDIASLAKFVALKGSLAEPGIGVSAEGSLKSALQLGAAVSTGGLSLIASGIADKAISGDACELAHNAFTK